MNTNIINLQNSNYFQELPYKFIDMDFKDSYLCLKKLISEEELLKAFDITKQYPSPVFCQKSTEWTNTLKMVGVNPRLTKTYWGIVKYAMTFPENGIHIMPLWQTSMNNSLYVQNNWELNKEFFDPDLAELGLDTCEKQLKLVVNVLHALGKTVGFDALPHVDNYSEIVLLHPEYFEWIKLNEDKSSQLFYPDVDNNYIHKEVEKLIVDFLIKNQDVNSNQIESNILNNFFSSTIDDDLRLDLLFGKDSPQRYNRRVGLIKYIREAGYEVIPVTEHIPCRPVLFDKMENGWAKFKVANINKESKIIGCITPYKWYFDDTQGYPDKNNINQPVWDYFADNLLEFQRNYNFDFMRCDMAHNQIAHSHNQQEKDYYNENEFWAYAKRKIQSEKPYFATLAEAFYNHYFIDGFQDMKNKNFDIVLGNLNFQYLNQEYISKIKEYSFYKDSFNFSPCVTIMSNDTDRERNNCFYQSPLANEIRIFTAYFLKYPSYMGMGIETRDLIPESADYYSADYVEAQPKEYKWGSNFNFFDLLSEIRSIYSELRDIIENQELVYMSTSNELSICWAYLAPQKDKLSYLFIINIDSSKEIDNVEIFNICNVENQNICLEEVFSNINTQKDVEKIFTGNSVSINLEFAECKIFKYSGL